MTAKPTQPSTPDEPFVLVIGEALMDLVVQHDAEADEAAAVPGGSPANVALALGRLGVPVELVTWIGKDTLGTAIHEHLGDSGVIVREPSLAADKTSTAIAKLDKLGAATYVFDVEWAPEPLQDFEDAQILHTGSIAAVLQPEAEAILDAIDATKGQALVTYDPNARPQLMGSPSETVGAVEAVVSRADVVKASDEDLEWLYPGSTAEQAALDWIERFDLPLIVVTRGKQGPMAYLGSEVRSSVAPAPVKVVDTVGAGDTFMGGLIDALWRRGIRGAEGRQKLSHLTEDDLRHVLQEAAELADIVVQRQGANPPWAAELGR